MIGRVLSGDEQWVVLHADAVDVLPTLSTVDAMITDPPYGIGEARKDNSSRSKLALSRDYGRSQWDDEPVPQSLIDAAVSRGRVAVVFGGNYYSLPPSPCWLVWDKLNGENDFADCELAWTNMDRAVRRLAYRWHGMIRENKEPRGLHPTQKPVGLMLWVLGLATTVGDVVLDPFAGSGTTGVAAIRSGRRFIGIERDRRYVDIMRERLEAESLGMTIEESRAGQLSLLGGPR